MNCLTLPISILGDEVSWGIKRFNSKNKMI
jgi:hypothetical protein